MSEQTPPLYDSSAAMDITPAPEMGAAPPAQPPAPPRSRGGTITHLALIAILIIAAFLRLSANIWDSPATAGEPSGHLHPDERFLTQISVDTHAPSSVLNYFDTTTSAASPYNIKHPDGTKQTTFVYGTLPLFLNKFVASHTDAPFSWIDTATFGHADAVNGALDIVTFGKLGLPERDYATYDLYTLSGRYLAGLFDLLTVVFIFLLACQLANRRVGLLAAFLYALTPFAIQNAHFFVVDPFVTTFATMTVYFAVKSAKRGGWLNFAAAGAAAGLAAACKITAVSLLPVAVLGVGVHAWPSIKPYLAPLWFVDSSEYKSQRNGRALDKSVATLVVGSLVTLLAGFIAFRIAMPYAFNTPGLGQLFSLRTGHLGPLPTVYPDIMNQHWLGDQVDQQKLLSGDAAYPPDIQWIGRSKWIWPAQQMISWGMGPALGITAWLGVIFVVAYVIKKWDMTWLIPLAWVLGYFGFMGMQFSLYMRYFLPLYPTLTVIAAFVMYQAWGWAGSPGALGRLGERLSFTRQILHVGVRSGVVVVITFTALAGVAFYHIYSEPISRAAASVWMYQNIPAGSVIGHEDWDDDVPYLQPKTEPIQYGSIKIGNFNPDNDQHVTQLLGDLDKVDYIALASRRLSGTITRVPAQWPVSSRYYAALDDGSLGFDLVAKFTQFPTIPGTNIEFDDTGAEESFTVYDHPQVFIYKKTDRYSPDKARLALHADSFIPGYQMLPGDAGQNALQFHPDVLATQQAGGTFTDIFDAGNVINRFPLFFWLIAVELAALSLVPLAAVVFRGLPDRGYLLTKPLGILALAYFAYVPASTGAVHYTRTEIAGGLLALLAIGSLTGLVWRKEVGGWLREHWRLVLLFEAIFLLAFLFDYWLRLQNPDLWHPYDGGEKPMDFAYFNGVIRTTDLTQGPIDPWQAGGYLNYYWFGQFIAATVTKLTGIVPEVAYNLVVPMFFALAAAATFSLAYNLAESTRRLMKYRPGRIPISARGPILAALLAVFFVLIAGNLSAVGYLHDALAKISPWISNKDACHAGTARCNAELFGIELPHSGDLFGINLPGVSQFIGMCEHLVGGTIVTIGGFKAILFRDASLASVTHGYDWWAPSRALSINPTPKDSVTPITEFPFWTFLFADLHAHLMAIPFSITAAAVSFGAVMNFTRINPLSANKSSREREIMSWVMVLVLALIVGALRWINSWDYPPFLILGAAAILIAERAKDGSFTLRSLVMGGVKVLAMAVLSYVFYMHVAKNYIGLPCDKNMPYDICLGQGGFHQSDQTTALSDYFTHFGVFVFILGGFVLFMLSRSITRNNSVRTVFFGGARRRAPIDSIPVVGVLVLGGAALVALGTGERWGVTVLALVGLVLVALCAARELRNPSPMAPVLLFVYAMVGLGLGLCGGVEVLTLDGDIGRMNTVFKFYLHVWTMWGIASAFAVWYVLAVMRPHAAFLRRVSSLNASLVRVPRFAFAAIVVVLLALTLVYPYFGTRARIHDRFNPAQGTGNNGLDFMRLGGPYVNKDPNLKTGGEHDMKQTLDAITWVRANIKGSPTTIEAIGPSYRSLGSRFAIYTGMPTVMGWEFHQSQQRSKFTAAVQQRQLDVNEFYTTEDVDRARAILRKYDVQYVIVGDEERFNYPPAGLVKFQNGLGGVLEKLYENDANQIWHVIPQSELDASAQASAAP